MTRTAHYYEENGKHFVHLRLDAMTCGVPIPVADEAAAEALARANAAGLRRGKPSPITAQLDRERGEFEQWAASTRTEVTVEEFNFARDAWLERARRERAAARRPLEDLITAAGHDALKAFDEQAPAIAASMKQDAARAEYLRDWAGRD